MADQTTERTAVHPRRPVGIRSTPTDEAVPEQMTACYTRPGQLCPAGARSTLPSRSPLNSTQPSTLPSWSPLNSTQLEPAQLYPAFNSAQLEPAQLYPAFNSALLEPDRCSPGADDVQHSITLSRVLRDTRSRRRRQQRTSPVRPAPSSPAVSTHLTLLDPEGRDGS